MTNITQEYIEELAQRLKKGETILYPTDTIWGLGCDAANETAVAKIYQIKQRPKNMPLVLLVSDMNMLQHYVERIPPKAGNLIEFYERPLTIIYKELRNLPSSILAEDGSIAIRVTKDPFCQAFIKAFGAAVVSTSANSSAKPFPTCYAAIEESIKNEVDFIVTQRLDEQSELTPSAIVSFDENEEIVFIRT